MATPEFVLKLRRKIGHDLLWLMGVSGYVEDERGRVPSTSTYRND